MTIEYAVDLGRTDATVIVEGVRHPDGRVVIYNVHELQPSCDAQGHHDKYCQMGDCQYAEIGLPRCQCHVKGGAK